MIEEEKYNSIINSLDTHLHDASDLINVQIKPYSEYFTTTGKLSARQPGFSINLIISNSYLSTRKITMIIADAFTRIDNWMEDWSEEIAFIDYKLSSVGGENPRLELKIIFDDLKTTARSLLLR